MLVTKKTADKLGFIINDGAGSAVSSFARRQMEKMGWTEGKGLGKNEDGISKHIKVQKRDDAAGLGTEAAIAESVSISESWWHDGFSEHLNKFGAKLGGKKKSKKNKDGKDKKGKDAMPSFDELFAATGGARLGMRARANQSGKFLRTETNNNNNNDVVSSTTPSSKVKTEETRTEATSEDKKKTDEEEQSKHKQSSKKRKGDREVGADSSEDVTVTESLSSQKSKKSKKSKKEKKEEENSTGNVVVDSSSGESTTENETEGSIAGEKREKKSSKKEKKQKKERKDL